MPTRNSSTSDVERRNRTPFENALEFEGVPEKLRVSEYARRVVIIG